MSSAENIAPEAVDYKSMFPVDPHYYASYFIDSFRSLQSFTIQLEEGLNVLVGPNGSGKTNFVDFLDFISVYLIRGASNAVSHMGGLARVFSQETLKSRSPRIRAKICALADLRPYIENVGDDRVLFRFEYEIDIRFSKQHSSLYIARESIKFKSAFWSDLAVFTDRTVGTMVLKRRSPLDSVDSSWEVGRRLLSNGSKNPMRFRGNFTWHKAEQSLIDEILQPPRLAPDESILSSRNSFPAFDAVRSALSRGRSFNLSPKSARVADDLSHPPIIGTDGSGLSATLFQMHQSRRRDKTSGPARRISKESLDNVVNWTSLVLPELKDIVTIADLQTGKYLSYLVVKSPDNTLRVPLQSASDGTLKWLSFVSLLNSRGGVYSLEEPENFLHPRMQSFLIDLIREQMEGDHPGHFIVTTHSESIINQCAPEEILLFNFADGRTVARRIKNADSLKAQINETGFGLGHYYVSNALS